MPLLRGKGRVEGRKQHATIHKMRVMRREDSKQQDWRLRVQAGRDMEQEGGIVSMLSSMTDKLRKTADEISRFRHGAVDFLQLGVAMADAASQMRDAADTIDYLRNTCDDIQRDYDNLRKAMWDRANARAIDFMTEDELRGLATQLYDHVDELKQLVRDMWRDGMCECDERGACTECEYGYLDRMRELGIEVG